MLRALDVRVVPPLRAELGDLLARPFTRTSLVTAAVIGVVFGLSDMPIPLLNLLIAFTGLVAVAGTWFNVIDHVGCGKPGFPAPNEAEGWEPSTLAIRGMLCLLLVFTPFGIWLALVPGAESIAELIAARPFTATLLGGVALAWLAAAVLAMLVTVRGLAAYWPPALVRAVALSPDGYARLLGVIAGTSTVCLLVRWVLRGLLGRIPFLGSFAVWGVSALALFAQAAVIGGLVHRNREVYTTR